MIYLAFCLTNDKKRNDVSEQRRLLCVGMNIEHIDQRYKVTAQCEKPYYVGIFKNGKPDSELWQKQKASEEGEPWAKVSKINEEISFE